MALPTTRGRHLLRVPTYRPVHSSRYGAWIGWLTGKLPEFHDPCFAAKATNRDVTRVEATGSVLVQVDVLHRGMEQAGYAVG